MVALVTLRDIVASFQDRRWRFVWLPTGPVCCRSKTFSRDCRPDWIFSMHPMQTDQTSAERFAACSRDRGHCLALLSGPRWRVFLLWPAILTLMLLWPWLAWMGRSLERSSSAASFPERATPLPDARHHSRILAPEARRNAARAGSDDASRHADYYLGMDPIRDRGFSASRARVVCWKPASVASSPMYGRRGFISFQLVHASRFLSIVEPLFYFLVMRSLFNEAAQMFSTRADDEVVNFYCRSGFFATAWSIRESSERADALAELRFWQSNLLPR